MSTFLYHEKQVGSLCGKHCLNALVQGPVFSEVDLMNCAMELDEKERQIMAESGNDSKEFLEFLSKDSQNISDDGNFSVQVLAKALEKKNLVVQPISKKILHSLGTSVLQENAFICNHGSHWYTIRKVQKRWYNCNSLNDKPVFMSDFYLASYIESLIDEGYTIYVVRGNFPENLPLNGSKNLGDGSWIRMTGSDEDDLRRAIEMSKQTPQPPTPVQSRAPIPPPQVTPSQEEIKRITNEVNLLRQEYNNGMDLIKQSFSNEAAGVKVDNQMAMFTKKLTSCFAMMEKLDSRLQHVESNLKQIVDSKTAK